MKSVLSGGGLGVLMVLLSSCGPGLFDRMGRTNEDPFTDTPQVISFESERSIKVVWKEDPGADEYLLRWAPDNGESPPNWKLAYRGTRRSFTHGGLENNERRLYRLSKTRGSRKFDPSDIVLGVSSDVIKDIYEPNDTREKAAELSYVNNANIQYYISETYREYGHFEYIDIDWYFVNVPPNRRANIVIKQRDLPAGGLFAFEVFDARAGVMVKDVKSNIPFSLENRSNTAAVIHFRISPKGENIITSGRAGGRTLNYTVTLESMPIIITGGSS